MDVSSRAVLSDPMRKTASRNPFQSMMKVMEERE